MIALLFAIAIVLFLGLVGLGVTTLFGRRLSLGILLLSPTIGMGVVLPIELTFNRAGLPVEAFGQWLVLGFAVLSGIILAIRRPSAPWSKLLPLIPAFAAGTLLAGAPFLLYGFHWAGNSNGDMAVYVSTADNFLHHGFFDVAPLHELIRGTDVPRNLWFWEVAPPNRFGTEVLLALAAAAAHLHAYEVYMPLSVAGFLMLIMGTGALCANPQMERRMVIATILIAVASPLMLFSVYQQVLPQLLGQVSVVAIVAAVQIAGGSGLMQRPVALGCCVTALSLIYPEISPLVLGTAAITAPVAFWHHRTEIAAYVKRIAPVAGIAVATVLLLQNIQFFTFAATVRVLQTIVSHSVSSGPGAITYYVIPSGAANLWGLVPLENYPEPWLSFAIAAGFVGFFAIGVVAVRSLLRSAKFSDGAIVGIQIVLLTLVIDRAGYTAFKTGFWLQPFLATAVALAILWGADRLARILRTPPVFVTAGLVALCLAATSFSTYTYLVATSDLLRHTRAEFTEINGASSGDLYGALDAMALRYANQIDRPIRMDAIDYQLDLLAGLALRGHPLEYQNADPFLQFFFGNTGGIVKQIVGWPAGLRDAVRRTAARRTRVFERKMLTLPSAMNHIEFTLADDPTAIPTRNIAPDSDAFYAGWSEWNPIHRGTVSDQHVDGVGPRGHSGWQATGDGLPLDAGVISAPLSVRSGETVTASVWIDPSGISSSFNSRIYINNADSLRTENLISGLYHGRKPGRVSISLTIPPGVASIYMLFSTDGAVLGNGQTFTWSMPMLEVSPRMTAYVPSSPFTRFYLYTKNEKIFVPPPQPFDRRDGLFLELGPQLSLLNRSQANVPFLVRLVPWNTMHNWLSLVDSDFGEPATLGEHVTPAMGDIEPDPYNQPNFMATVGRSMLLEVINAPPTVRLQLALTSTFNPRPYVQVPPIVIVGTSRLKIPSVGAGSARIITPPIRPFTAFGRRYLILYFGDRLVKFTTQRAGLMNLYGRDIDLDPRRFALFGRDISIAGPPRRAPVLVGSFPADLMNPDLIYSGIFEDGWVGRKFSVRLHSNDKADGLRLRLTVPPESVKQLVIVKIDGRLSARITAKPSTFVDVNLPGAPPGDHLVSVQAVAAGRHVLRHDARPVWARLREIGFDPGGDAL